MHMYAHANMYIHIQNGKKKDIYICVYIFFFWKGRLLHILSVHLFKINSR